MGFCSIKIPSRVSVIDQKTNKNEKKNGNRFLINILSQKLKYKTQFEVQYQFNLSSNCLH